MRRSPRWLKRKKTEPELAVKPPIRLGNMSNGEFFHEQTPMERRVYAEIMRQAEDKSRKLGMDRREFLASAMGMCTSLSVLNMAAACSSGSAGNGKKPGTGFIDMGANAAGSSGGMGMAGSPGAAGSFGGSGMNAAGASSTSVGSGGYGGSGGAGRSGSMSGGSSGSGGMSGSPGSGGAGGYNIPPDATMDCGMAENVLNGKGEFIFDIQTHHIEEEGSWRTTNPTAGDILATYFQQYNQCMAADLKTCIDAQAYLEQIFLNSDTTLCVLSGFPEPLCTDGNMTNCGNPLDNDAMWMSRDKFNMLANSQRVINHCQVNPTDNLQMQLAIMENVKTQHNCWGFKSYPEWGPTGKGWMLNDADSGIPMIEKARQLNSKIICVHKGIVFPGWDANSSDPKDIGIVAKMYPDVAFVCYHSAIEIDASGEDVYNPMNTLGTDRLCRTVDQNGLKGMNVYAELGSVWAQVMNAPTKAQHVIGKLLKYVGEDNVVWGSECIWLGSPQPQIEAFRTFQISQEFQDMYGYPALTDQLKAKIFGLNAAKVYGINPDEVRCKITATKLASLKTQIDGEQGGRRWAFQELGGPRTRREFWNLARLKKGRPG